MDGLEIPFQFAGHGIHRDDRIRKEIVSGAVHAIEVVVGGPEWHVQDAAFFVDREEGPGVRTTDVTPRVIQPGVVPDLAGPWYGVKRPHMLTRS